MFKKLVLAPFIVIATSFGIVAAASLYGWNPTLAENYSDKQVPAAALPVEQKFFPDVALLATGAFVGRVNTETNTLEPVYEKNKSTVLPIASISKLLTAHVILQEKLIPRTFTVTEWAISGPWPSNKFEVGTSYTIQELLEAALIESNNDAARIIASQGSEYAFVKKMNLEAKEIGLSDTTFYTSDGTEKFVANKGLENTSTPEDVAHLITYLYKNSPEILKLTKQPSAMISDNSGKNVFTAYSTNRLLDYFSNGEIFLGGKTGTSDPNRKHLVFLVQNKKGDIFVCVVLQSKDNFSDMKILLDALREYSK